MGYLAIARQKMFRPHGAVTIFAGAALAVMILMAILAPVIAPLDPQTIDSLVRLKPPSAEHLLGTDAVGRDLFSRVVYGARVSLAIGGLAAAICVVIGMSVGLLCGYSRPVDAVAMRILDGLMAIPGILLAIAVVSLAGPSLWSVLFAVALPEFPRVVRVVRSVVFSAREEAYVEAARSLGSSPLRIIWRHLLPNTVAPVTVQASYVCAAAILTESILSFLGTGIDPSIPTWGNIIASGRNYFQIVPSLVLWPGLLLSITILSINLIGDALRDALDPTLARGRDGR